MRIRNSYLFLSRKEKRRVIEAIRSAERGTSGEIRVHLVLRFKKDPAEEARRIFERLGMGATRERNAVLIVLAVQSRQFVILGDQAIDEKVPASYWQETARRMEEGFRGDRFGDALSEAVRASGEELAKHFSRKRDDANELPDGLSYSF